MSESVTTVSDDDLNTLRDDPSYCNHQWQPLSFVFETQLLDGYGRVTVRQPGIEAGKVYCVCVPCASHTYLTTSWVGYRLYGSEDRP